MAESLDSVPTALEAPAAPATRVGRSVPGVVAAAIGAAVALVATQLTGISSMLVAIILGAVAANLGALPRAADPGITLVGKRVLRIGVALLGLQLVIGDILALGAGMVAVIVAVVAVGISATMLIGRWLGIGLTQRLLIACGFSICGAAAVAATDGVIDADESETASAVGLVVLFGTLMIPVVPLAGHLLGLPDREIGLWAGGSIHEVAQVVAAGGAIGGAALTVAVLVKLGRVLMLAPVLAVISFWMRRRTDVSAVSHASHASQASLASHAAHASLASHAAHASLASRPPIVPLFVAAFLALAVVRSTGIVPGGVVAGAHTVQTVALTMAMFALGCGVRVAALRRGGARPLVLATLSTVVVASTALAGVTLLATP